MDGYCLYGRACEIAALSDTGGELVFPVLSCMRAAQLMWHRMRADCPTLRGIASEQFALDGYGSKLVVCNRTASEPVAYPS